MVGGVASDDVARNLPLRAAIPKKSDFSLTCFWPRRRMNG
jgi:hypothetical protein